MILSIVSRAVAMMMSGVMLFAVQTPSSSGGFPPEQILPVTYELRGLDAPPVSVIAIPTIQKSRAQHLELQGAAFRKPLAASDAPDTIPFAMTGEQALTMGKALDLDREFQMALPYLREAVKQLPRSFEAQAELGDCEYMLLHDDEALASYTAVVKQYVALRDEGSSSRSEVTRLTPRFAEIQFNLGSIHLDHGRFAEANAAFNESLKIKANDADTMTGLGIALLKQGHATEAIPYFKQVVTLQPLNPEAHYNLGEAYASDQQWLVAAESFQAAARLKPTFPEPLFNSGVMLYNADRIQDAVNAFIEARKIDLTNIYAALYLAEGYNRLGNSKEAIAYYRAYLKGRPDNVVILLHLAYLLVNLQQHGDAEDQYKKILTIDPQNADASANLAALQSRRNHVQPVGITLRQAAVANPNSAEVHINLGAQLINEKAYLEGVQILKKAVALRPDSAAGFYNLGLAQSRAGIFKDAATSLERATQLKPNWPAAYNSLGQAYAGDGRWQEASKAFQEAVRVSPEYAGAQFNLGYAYVKLGQKSLASQQVERLKPLSTQLPSRLQYEIGQMDAANNQSSVAAATPLPTPLPQPVPTPTPVVVAPPSSAQAPTVSSLNASSSTITAPCPAGTMSSSCATSANSTIQLTAEVTTNDNTELLYSWLVTAGKIVGAGRSVRWDLADSRPGTYTAVVAVSDGIHAATTASTIVTIAACTDCAPYTCPSISVSCPGSVAQGTPITFTTNFSGNEAVTYNWSVSAGTITMGQGTSTITVDTSGLGGQTVTATVELGGLNPSCSRAASCTSSIAPK